MRAQPTSATGINLNFGFYDGRLRIAGIWGSLLFDQQNMSFLARNRAMPDAFRDDVKLSRPCGVKRSRQGKLLWGCQFSQNLLDSTHNLLGLPWMKRIGMG